MQRIAIIGTGRMAPGIAAACGRAAAEVRLLGRDRGRAEEAAAAARAAAEPEPIEVSAATIEPEAVSGSDIVIETISEDADAKRELLGRIETWIAGDALIATNTSSLRIAALADALQHPERFIGLHFLNPADCTPVVEVIPGPATAESSVETALELGRAMGKQPLLARKDVPGFIWNRLQFAVLRECLHLLEQGVADIATIDAAVADGLAPRWAATGPLATADLGGLATFATVAGELFGELASDDRPQAAITERAEAGEGFYEWTEESEEALAALRRRLILEASDRAGERRALTPPSVEDERGSA